jgi:hypothetical protein
MSKSLKNQVWIRVVNQVDYQVLDQVGKQVYNQVLKIYDKVINDHE